MKQFRVTQIRSNSGRSKAVLATLSSLGLGRIGKSKVHTASPAMKGMIRRVMHVVRLDEIS